MEMRKKHAVIVIFLQILFTMLFSVQVYGAKTVTTTTWTGPVNKTTTGTKTSTQTSTMSKKAAKTYSSSKTTCTSRRTYLASQTSKKKVIKSVTVMKTVTTKYTKGSKTKKVITKIVTTTKTMTYTAKTVKTTVYETGDQPDIDKIAPLADQILRDAFHQVGMKILINTGASSAGQTSMKNKTITLKKADDVVYHELGHFLSCMAGSYSSGSKFTSIYEEEKMKYTKSYSSYIRSSAAEYFAESYKDYILDRANLKATRPKTYAAIVEALSNLTPEMIAKQTALLNRFQWN
jgi:hypothetical protein